VALASSFPLEPPVQLNLKAGLVIIDLSHVRQLKAIAAAGLGALRHARLPPHVQIAGFDGCSQLKELLPTEGASELLSLQCDGCWRLGSSSFRAAADGGWHLVALQAHDLSWCTAMHALTLSTLLPSVRSLRHLSLRGLKLHGVLKSVVAAPIASRRR